LSDPARIGDVDGVRAALAAGVTANADYGLQWAAAYGHAEVVSCLLAAGADVHDNDDASLRWAASGGHVGVVRILLAAGADPVTAWMTSAASSQDKIADSLDACAEAIRPEQRTLLAQKSAHFIRLQALARSASCRQGLRR